MKAKSSVVSDSCTKQIIVALGTACEVYARHSCELVWTSGNDSAHGPLSLHYSGDAIDLRLPSRCLHGIAWSERTSEIDRDVVSELGLLLGANYDVVLEDESYHPGKPYNMHIHVEYDPK